MAGKKKSEAGNKPAKKPCPITRDQFNAHSATAANDVRQEMAKVMPTPKVFKTGSFGWNLSGKLIVMIDGVPVKIQLTGNAVVCNSGPGDEEATAEPPAANAA